MRPDAVMGEEEKHVRFRKVILKHRADPQQQQQQQQEEQLPLPQEQLDPSSGIELLGPPPEESYSSNYGKPSSSRGNSEGQNTNLKLKLKRKLSSTTGGGKNLDALQIKSESTCSESGTDNSSVCSNENSGPKKRRSSGGKNIDALLKNAGRTADTGGSAEEEEDDSSSEQEDPFKLRDQQPASGERSQVELVLDQVPWENYFTRTPTRSVGEGSYASSTNSSTNGGCGKDPKRLSLESRASGGEVAKQQQEFDKHGDENTPSAAAFPPSASAPSSSGLCPLTGNFLINGPSTSSSCAKVNERQRPSAGLERLIDGRDGNDDLPPDLLAGGENLFPASEETSFDNNLQIVLKAEGLLQELDSTAFSSILQQAVKETYATGRPSEQQQQHQSPHNSHQQLPQQHLQQPQLLSHCPTIIPKCKKLSERINSAWRNACNTLNVEGHFLHSLKMFHHGCMEAITKELLEVHFVTLANLLRTFAVQLPEFSSLPNRDQRKLLERNSVLFISYILCRYFTASSGPNQLNWMFANALPFSSRGVADMGTAQFVAPGHVIKLFTDNAEAIYRYGPVFYSPDIQNITLPLLAASCLYQSNFVNSLNSWKLVDQHKESVYSMAMEVHLVSEEQIGGLIETLERVSRLMLDSVGSKISNVVCTSHSLIRVHREMKLSYSETESTWLTQKLDVFEQCHARVSYGEVLFNDSILFSLYGTPLPKSYMGMLMRLYHERASLALNESPEFTHLDPSQQSGILKLNVYETIGLSIAKLESMHDGCSQLRFVLGSADEKLVKSLQKGREPVRPISIKDVNNTANALSFHEATRFRDLCLEVGNFAHDMESFKILYLLVLMSDDYVKDTEIRQSHNGFFSHLMKRLVSHLRDEMETEIIMTRYKQTLRNIKELTGILIKGFESREKCLEYTRK